MTDHKGFWTFDLNNATDEFRNGFCSAVHFFDGCGYTVYDAADDWSSITVAREGRPNRTFKIVDGKIKLIEDGEKLD